MIIEKVKFQKLYDFYSQLLTERQREIFEATSFEDLSLAEASEQFGISRAAVQDTIKKVEKLLVEFEIKLGLNEKSQKRSDLYKEIEDLELRDELEALELE